VLPDDPPTRLAVHASPDSEKGPDPYEPATRRRNVRTLLAVGALVALAAVLPGTCRRITSPDVTFATATEARGTAALPSFVPPSATDIHLRHDRRTGRRIARFDYDPDAEAALVAGMRPVPDPAAEAIPAPASGWAGWFPINSRTLSGRQGEYLRVFEIITGPDRGWLALDPRTRHAYYWTDASH
jgi:hypothetical protein